MKNIGIFADLFMILLQTYCFIVSRCRSSLLSVQARRIR